MGRALLVVAVVVALAMQSSAPPRVAIVRATVYAFEDEPISVMVQVDPRAANRLLVVAVVDGDVTVRLSREELFGEASPRTRWVRWPRVPAGEDMVLVAALFESGETPVARATAPLTVLSRRH
jgi:hypothetical protein